MFRKPMLGLLVTVVAAFLAAGPGRAQTTEPFQGSGLATIYDANPVDEGTLILYTMSGESTVVGAYDGVGQFVLSPDGVSFMQGRWMFAGTLTILGGTGQFANATGSADITGQPQDDVTLSVMWTEP